MPHANEKSMKLYRIAGITAFATASLLILNGCTTMSARDTDTAIGAGIGAVGGAVLTGGSAAGTIGGAAVGGVIGNQIGKTKEGP
jgi:osmotically inducible lipoprotein OsmB